MAQMSTKRRLSQVASLAPQARTASANGSSADLSGYLGAVAVLVVGTITDGTHTPKLQESNDNSTFTDVVAGDLEGSFANLVSATNQAVGYKGRQRYIRIVFTVSGTTTGGVYGGVILRGDPLSTPAP